MSDKRIGEVNSDSPLKFVSLDTIGMGASLLGNIGGAIFGGRARRKAKRAAKRARKKMRRLEGIYKNLDTSNPFADIRNQYAGMENTMDDLTVNQQQAQFERDQFQQSQANILGDLRGAAGGSGIGALAQSLAQQGQIAAQKSSASIGAQEAQNQRMQSAEAGRLQEMEAQGQANVDQLRGQGKQHSQQMEMQKQGTLLGMAQSQHAAAQQQSQAANQSLWSSIGSTVQSGLDFAGGIAADLK